MRAIRVDLGPYTEAVGQFITVEDALVHPNTGLEILKGRVRPLGPDGDNCSDLSFTALARTITDWLTRAVNHYRSDFHWVKASCPAESGRRGNPGLYRQPHHSAWSSR